MWIMFLCFLGIAMSGGGLYRYARFRYSMSATGKGIFKAAMAATGGQLILALGEAKEKQEKADAAMSALPLLPSWVEPAMTLGELMILGGVTGAIVTAWAALFAAMF